MIFPTPVSPIPILKLGDVSAFMVEITAAHVAAGTNYHTFFVIASAGCKVYWGDGAVSTLSTGTNTCTHTYASGGYYLIQIVGTHTRFYHALGSTAGKVIEAVKLYTGLTSTQSAFTQCNNAKFKVNSGFRFGNNIISHYGTFSECSGNSFSLPEGLVFSPVATTIGEFVRACGGTGFTSLPSTLKPSSAVRNMEYFAYNASRLTHNISNFFPTWPGGITMGIGAAFIGTKITGTAPADKLWNRADITWFQYTTAAPFLGVTTLSNYASIPAGWK